MRLPTLCCALLILLATGCAPKRVAEPPPAAAGDPAADASSPRPTPTPVGAAWTAPDGPLRAAGLELAVPAGWTTRIDGGTVRARSADGAIRELQVGPWSGDSAHLAARHEGPLTFRAAGPHGPLEGLAIGELYVATWPARDGDVGCGWYLTHGDGPVAIEAIVDGARFEEGWRALQELLQHAARLSGTEAEPGAEIPAEGA